MQLEWTFYPRTPYWLDKNRMFRIDVRESGQFEVNGKGPGFDTLKAAKDYCQVRYNMELERQVT